MSRVCISVGFCGYKNHCFIKRGWKSTKTWL